jgi:chemotaxis protein methyltransferase CheR
MVNMPSDAARFPYQPNSVEEVEVSLLLEGLNRLFGYDFRQYAPKSVRRRILDLLAAEGLNSISGLQDRVFHDSEVRDRLVSSLSIQVSEFFRDPDFFQAFRMKAIPLLRTYPQIRVWHAGCASGEEVYSMAILLEEEGLLGKSLLYATDINARALQAAMRGVYSIQHVGRCETNYKNAGGTRNLWSYLESDERKVRVDPALRSHIVFSQHNLVTDGSFNEFNVILCRNVLLYFTAPLRDRVHALLHSSLTRFGLLALGANETIRFTAFENQYRALDEDNNLYRRVN